MKQQIQAFIAEIYKAKHAKIKIVTFLAFGLAPLFGGVLMFLMKDNGYNGLSGALKTKAMMMSFEANWNSYLGLLSQAIGIGGVLVFGFIASWLFGREYSDGTAKDLLSLPISRTKILNAKFAFYWLWCFLLVVSNLFWCLLIGSLLQLPGWEQSVFLHHVKISLVTYLLMMLLNTPVAFWALWGKGYMTPLGFVALLLVFSQIIGALGFGQYFPWSVPGIYSGGGGETMKLQLNFWSYFLVFCTGFLGYIATIFWWKNADQLT